MRYEGGGHRPAVAFDPQGVVFAAAICGGRIKLFDVRAYDKGAFLTFLTSDLGGSRSFSGIKFSNDGAHMLLCTTGGTHALLDAFKGNIVQTYSGHITNPDAQPSQPLEACFGPYSEFVLAGGGDGGIWRWETRSGKALRTLRGHHAPVGAIRCNPTRMMIASADTATCLWLPD